MAHDSDTGGSEERRPGRKPVAAVADAGFNEGLPLARRFAEAGYAVALLARRIEMPDPSENRVEGVRCFACDVGRARSISHAFREIERELGEVDALLYNAGSSVFVDVRESNVDQVEHAWRDIRLGAFLCAREVIPAMKAKGTGTIVFVGDTETCRARMNRIPPAPDGTTRRLGPEEMALEAQRFLARSMAEELGPDGIHVASIVIDGVLDLPRTRRMMPDIPGVHFVDPADVADVAYRLSSQDRGNWTLEVGIGPSGEDWTGTAT